MTSDSHSTLTPAQRAYRFLNRPYYIYRPSQLRQRMRANSGPEEGPRLLRTAWGSELYCWPDTIGRAVARTGVHDLIVMEALARLADQGELVIDAGAHVGLMSNLLAYAVGASGRVVAYEPHPENFELLRRNVELWRERAQVAPVEAREAAVSATAGTLALAIDPATFAHNKGTASLEPEEPTNATDVRTVRLDDEFSTRVALLKLDVEMHEHAALLGAAELLERHLVRDILLEEHDPPPTPVTELLEHHGYTVLGLRQGLAGPILCTPAQAHERKLWDSPALLASSQPDRVHQRMRARGWVTLRSGLGRRA